MSSLAADIPDRDLRAAGPTVQRSDALREVLEQLGERVKPVALARERTLPVAEPLREVLGDGALVRGRVMSCRGAAAATIANAVVRDALVAGAWLAVVDIESFGLDAAAEIGVPLERVVRVESGAATSDGTELDWIDVMGAAVDGFDIVLTSVPAALCGDRRPAAVRKLASRVQQRGAVVVVLGETGAFTSDIDLVTERTVWDGLGAGVGHLRRRQVDITARGRRAPSERTASIRFGGVGHQVEMVSVAAVPVAATQRIEVVDLDEARDPQSELLAEMAESLDASSDTGSELDSDHRLVG